ncbi:MAG: NAD(+) synthase [Polyangiaceae bacterium]
MNLVSLAIVNVNATVGATKTNTDKVVAKAREAAAAGATLAAFPEQVLGGYSPEDLVQWRSFVDAQWTELARFAKETADLGMASVVGVTVRSGAHLYNAAALVFGGKVHGVVPKEKLPTYNVFYEARTFARGAPGFRAEVDGVPFGDLLFELDFGTVALEVCEDVWSPDGPMRRRSYAGAELVVNVSASPFRLGVVATRKEMLATRAMDNQVTVLYANLVGANDGLVFDGGGYVSQNGRLMVEAPRFREGVTLATVDLDRTRRLRTENTTWRNDQEIFRERNAPVGVVKVPGATKGRERLTYPIPSHGSFFLPPPDEKRSARAEFCEDVLDTLALGVGDYFEKTGAFRTIGVALSGGRDSLLCLVVARRFVDRRFAFLDEAGRKAKAASMLRAFFMPSRYSSKATAAAAARAAADLDVPFVEVSIDDVFEKELAVVASMLRPGESLGALARQNVQARIRAERMWTWANGASGLFLQTSNMSEKAVGYTTIGGDMEGALSVIANVPKTVVNYLLDYLLETTGMEGIRLTLEKPASAELADDQEDEKDLMPFPVLDACFALYAGEKMSVAEVATVLAALFPSTPVETLDGWTKKFARLFTQSIYKWVQTPLAIHVGNLDLDRERALQLPVVQKTEW